MARFGLASMLLGLGLTVLATAQAPQIRIASQPYRPGVSTYSVAATNVEIAVVVHDAGGHAIGTLGRSDFAVQVDGKPLPIAGFRVERASAIATEPARGVSGSEAAVARRRPEVAALFFDDNSMPVADMNEAREAAAKLVQHGLPQGVRMGVFTASGAVQQDFTRSTAVLLASLHKLVARPRMPPQGPKEGLHLPPYLAYWVNQDDSPNSRSPFMKEAVRRLLAAGQCRLLPVCVDLAIVAARTTTMQANMVSRDTLNQLLQVINRLQGQPGRRTLLLASSGFLTIDLGAEIAQVTAAALHAGVVIDALDAKMLWTYQPHPTTMPAFSQSAPEELNAVMASLAHSTGGRFVHNTNDLAGGLRRSLTPEARYVLSVIPASMPSDGKFHRIQVRLLRPHLTAEARRGYYDPEPGLAPLSAATQKEIADAADDETTPDAFGMEVTGDASHNRRGASEMWVHLHIDVAKLPFVKQHGRERDELTIVTVVFDMHNHYVIGQEGRIALAMTPSSLRKTRRTGVDTSLALRVPPGTYRLRLVAREANGGWMTAKNAAITVP